MTYKVTQLSEVQEVAARTSNLDPLRRFLDLSVNGTKERVNNKLRYNCISMCSTNRRCIYDAPI